MMKATTRIVMGVTMMVASSSSSSPSSLLWPAVGVKRRRRAPNLSSLTAFVHGSRGSSQLSKGIAVDGDHNIASLGMVWRDESSRGSNNSNANNNSNNNNSSSGPRRTLQSQESTTTRTTITTGANSGSATSSNSRNRGANAANHNRRGHSLRLSNKFGVGTTTAPTTSSSAGSSKRTMNTKRPPRWEREGDKLYAEVTKVLDALTDTRLQHDNDEDNDDDDTCGSSSSNIRTLLMQLANISNNKQITPIDVCQLLEPWTTTATITDIATDTTSKSSHNDNDNIKTETANETKTAEAISSMKDNLSNNDEQNKKAATSIPKNFLWGTLPVGPVLAQRLYNSGRASPTSVQIAAFPILSASVPITAQQQQQQQKSNNGYNSNSRSNRARTSSSSSNNINSSSRWTTTRPTTTTITATRSNKTKVKNNTKQRVNGIIASPTGTGKTLAYLLPLLCTSPGGQHREGLGGVLIVTPTIELACQIQREVDVLWPPSSRSVPSLRLKEEEKVEEEQKLLSSSLFVVGDVHHGYNIDDTGGEIDDEDDDEKLFSNSSSSNISPGRMILRSIERTAPTIIAGTPKMLRALYREAGRIVSSSSERNVMDGRYSESSRTYSKNNHKADDGDNIIPTTEGERATATALLTNLRAIVLDETDRLLRTEAVARETTERKNRKAEERKIEEDEAAATTTAATTITATIKKRPKLVIARQTQTEYLLRDIPVSLDAVQIICASATVGRTMRRQLMQILNKNSADSAATLITGNDDLRVKSKDMDTRKSVLLPERLQHAYRVVTEDDTDCNNVINNIEQEDDEDEEHDDDANEEEFTFDANVGTSNFIMPSLRNEDKRVKQTINALWSTMMMSGTEAKPIIIFPGRLGVERVQQELMSRGLTDVRTLRNLDGKRNMPATTEDTTTKNNNNSEEDIDIQTSKWKSIPVYIIGERFARGLDLPDVEYVFLLSPPSSAAGYAHMAGRTGRSGRTGLAFTLVRPKNNEVQRLAAIADALGLKFMSSISGVVEKVVQE